MPDVEESCLYLLAHALGHSSAPKAQTAVSRNVELSQSQLASFTRNVERRNRREPLQYIVGDWDFGPLRNLIVRPPLLCPRPETEALVSIAASTIQGLGSDCRDGTLRMLEVGCGTGAIALAVLKLCPGLRATAIDIAEEAVAVTKENAVLQGLGDRIEVLHANARQWSPASSPSPTAASDSNPNSRFDILISNPPYLPADHMTTLQPEIADWEDHRALAGGEPYGLGFVIDLLLRSAGVDGRLAGRAVCSSPSDSWLRPGAHIFLETHTTHPSTLARILDTLDGSKSVAEGWMGHGAAGSSAQMLPASGLGPPLPLHARHSDDNPAGLPLAGAPVDGVPADIVSLLRSHYWLQQCYYDFRRNPRFVHLRKR